MKTSGRCPKCLGEKIYLIDPVQQTYCDAGGTLRSFHITSAELPTGETGMFGGEKRELQPAGPFNACVCAACGYVEWYLPERALKMLERMVEARAVRVTKATPGATPFR